MFRKIMVANRGEIAVRVIRACRELGVKTVAVYSEADADSLHVRYADECHFIGAAEPSQSYLNMEKIIEVAKKSGCEAIHPGYGFLSQIPAFAQACSENDLVFIGPTAAVLRRMGNKVEARKAAANVGVPVIPGSLESLKSIEEAMDFARELGYPVLVKAVFGGGGKGMRLVQSGEEMQKVLETASLEAEASFGSREIYVEKFLPRARHIEFQILADGKGNIIHLGERECSIQRRCQKLVEETPSPFLTEELRKEMGEAAVKIAKAIGYVNVGTVEFLVDQNRNYYFLEMNTRLQVEHLITEMATGIDIVKEQIRIAAGEELAYKQTDIKVQGHAINCRINAEDPYNNFAPSPGTITNLHLPGGPGVRIDTHLYVGYTVPVFYDPLIAKLAVWGLNRLEAIRRMRNALEEFVIEGVRTTLPLHKAIMENEDFLKGEFHINFVDERIEKLLSQKTLTDEEIAALAIVLLNQASQTKVRALTLKKARKGTSPWKMTGRTWRCDHSH